MAEWQSGGVAEWKRPAAAEGEEGKMGLLELAGLGVGWWWGLGFEMGFGEVLWRGVELWLVRALGRGGRGVRMVWGW